MNKIFTNIRAGKVLMLTALTVFAMASCSKDDEVPNLTALTTPTTSQVSSTVHSLDFQWDKVSNATQYAYELKDPNGTLVNGGVTTGTTASFAGLEPNTTYTLTVWAYAAYGSNQYKKSEVCTLTATTPAIVPLGVPEPVVECNQGTAVATWPEVNHAGYYKVTMDGSAEQTVYNPTVTFKGLTTGTHTMTVQAISTEEAYSNSEKGSVTFEITVTKQVRWKGVGTFNDGCYYKTDYSANITAYDDGTYVLSNWMYPDTGCDLEFTVNSSNEIVIQNCTHDSYGYDNVVWWSDESGDYTAGLYPTDGYSYFNENTGEMWVYISCYGYSGYYEFNFRKTQILIKTPIWTKEANYNDGGAYYGANYTTTLTAYDDGSYKIAGWMYPNGGSDMEFTVNEDNTITPLSPLDSSGYYDVEWWEGGYYMYVYPFNGYSKFDATNGTLNFYIYNNAWYNYKLTWDPE